MANAGPDARFFARFASPVLRLRVTEVRSIAFGSTCVADTATPIREVVERRDLATLGLREPPGASPSIWASRANYPRSGSARVLQPCRDPADREQQQPLQLGIRGRALWCFAQAAQRAQLKQ